MLINWFTVIAQLINFFILVFLLQRFLYKPIVKTIRARQDEIKRNWQEAEAKQERAEAQIALYQEKQTELEQHQQDFITQAKEEAQREYQLLIQQAKDEVRQKQISWENAIAQQQQQYSQDLEQKLTQQVYEVARKTLQDLANASLETQIVQTFIRRLQNLDAKEKVVLAERLKESDNGLLIASSFKLSVHNRQQIVSCLEQQQIHLDREVRFVEVPTLICGIELQGKNYKVSWNVNTYLSSLQHYSSG